MLTVIDGGGESSSCEKPIIINNTGLVDISTSKVNLPADQQHFEMAIKELNQNGKILLFHGLQKELSNCLKSSSRLLMQKNERRMKGDEKGAEAICKKHEYICHRERMIWRQLRILYNILRTNPVNITWYKTQ